MKKIKVDKVILYYMDRVDPDGNLYREHKSNKIQVAILLGLSVNQ